MRTNLFKYGLTALMMAFAMTLCYSCSSDDEETIEELTSPSNGDGQINGHAYVKLAGLKWATENVGKVENVEAIGTNATFGYYYTQDDSKLAAESWGSSWRLPTEEQWKELIKKCKWEWITCDKQVGYKISDKQDSSKYIFLPAAGFCPGRGFDVGSQSDNGSYWSADKERCLFFFEKARLMLDGNLRAGLPVRPVSE